MKGSEMAVYREFGKECLPGLGGKIYEIVNRKGTVMAYVVGAASPNAAISEWAESDGKQAALMTQREKLAAAGALFASEEPPEDIEKTDAEAAQAAEGVSHAVAEAS